jgi:bromodomain-containing factor 1
VNGTGNNDAFSSNQTILTNLSEPSLESQTSPSALDPSGLQDTNTSTEADTSFDGPQFENGLVSAEFAIESAIEDIAPTSTIPPVIEAQESDLRGATQPPAPEAHLQEHSQDNALDFSDDHEALANQTAELDVDTNSPREDINFDPLQTTILTPPSDLQPPQPTMSNADPLSAQRELDQSQEDTIMDDAPPTSAQPNLTRPREDDDEDEPSAKRTKTEDADSSFQDAPIQNGNGEHEDDAEITPYAAKEISKIVKNIARTPHGKNFKQPVAKLWPNFAAAYAERISNEIDLETMDNRLRDQVYHTMGDLKKDIELLYTNALTFNGADHMVTSAGLKTRDGLLSKIANVGTEPPAPVKKEKKAAPKRPTPVPSARRASRGSHGATLPTPQPTQTFALDPTSNTPLIRRDSTKLDGGRPKREIHPPKNKDLPYSVRPKSKKHAHELKFCEDILTEIHKSKHIEFVGPFEHPVDPVALNIPHYFTIIKKPMDLSTMSKKLKGGSYTSAADFDKDMKQMLANCYKFNPAPNPINALGKRLEELYKTLWDRKDQYLADRSPPAASPSAGESEDDDDDEEDVVVDKTQDNTLSAAKDRLIEEQSKLVTLMGSKHPDQGLIQMQRDMVGVIQRRILEEETALKSKSKKKSVKPTKKAAPVKKASSSTSKKSGGSSKRYMGTLEKETISAGLGALPDDVSNEVLADIKKERPGLDVSHQFDLSESLLIWD